MLPFAQEQRTVLEEGGNSYALQRVTESKALTIIDLLADDILYVISTSEVLLLAQALSTKPTSFRKRLEQMTRRCQTPRTLSTYCKMTTVLVIERNSESSIYRKIERRVEGTRDSQSSCCGRYEDPLEDRSFRTLYRQDCT